MILLLPGEEDDKEYVTIFYPIPIPSQLVSVFFYLQSTRSNPTPFILAPTSIIQPNFGSLHLFQAQTQTNQAHSVLQLTQPIFNFFFFQRKQDFFTDRHLSDIWSFMRPYLPRRVLVKKNF